MTVGEKIKFYRLENGWTQKELADLSGVTRVSIGQYERGERFPKIDTTMLLAEALGLSILEFIHVSTDELVAELGKREGFINEFYGG